jgi:hypothetical protein
VPKPDEIVDHSTCRISRLNDFPIRGTQAEAETEIKIIKVCIGKEALLGLRLFFARYSIQPFPLSSP